MSFFVQLYTIAKWHMLLKTSFYLPTIASAGCAVVNYDQSYNSVVICHCLMSARTYAVQGGLDIKQQHKWKKTEQEQ